jgi:hypothetical protein
MLFEGWTYDHTPKSRTVPHGTVPVAKVVPVAHPLSLRLGSPAAVLAGQRNRAVHAKRIGCAPTKGQFIQRTRSEDFLSRLLATYLRVSDSLKFQPWGGRRNMQCIIVAPPVRLCIKKKAICADQG